MQRLDCGKAVEGVRAGSELCDSEMEVGFVLSKRRAGFSGGLCACFHVMDGVCVDSAQERPLFVCLSTPNRYSLVLSLVYFTFSFSISSSSAVKRL